MKFKDSQPDETSSAPYLDSSVTSSSARLNKAMQSVTFAVKLQDQEDKTMHPKFKRRATMSVKGYPMLLLSCPLAHCLLAAPTTHGALIIIWRPIIEACTTGPLAAAT